MPNRILSFRRAERFLSETDAAVLELGGLIRPCNECDERRRDRQHFHITDNASWCDVHRWPFPEEGCCARCALDQAIDPVPAIVRAQLNATKVKVIG